MLDVMEFEHSFFRNVLEVFTIVWRGVHEILFFELLFCIIPGPVRQQRWELFNWIKLLNYNDAQISILFVVIFKNVFAEIVVEIVDDVVKLFGSFLVWFDQGVGAVHREVLRDLLLGAVAFVDTHIKWLACALFVFLYHVALLVWEEAVVTPQGLGLLWDADVSFAFKL